MLGFKHFAKVLSFGIAALLALSACSSGNPGVKKSQEKVDTSKFQVAVKNEGKAIQGGILKYALVSDTAFEGILNRAFYQGEPDAEVLNFFDESLLSIDENYIYNQKGAATYTLSPDKKTITLKIKYNVKWHDGMPVTAGDLEYAYLVIGSPKYDGVRYDTQMSMIEGMEDYHEGKAQSISGVKVIDSKTISITTIEPNPSVLTGLWTNPLHKEYLKDVPIEKLAESPKIRVNPIGFGPFKVKKITPGEAVEYEAFKDYYLGAPKLDGVLLKVVNPQVLSAALEKGEYDIASVGADSYDQVKELKNIQLLGRLELAYSYIGFKLGHRDAATGKTVMDNPKFADKRLRKAIGYAIDNQAVGEKFYKGLRSAANSVIPPSQPKYHDKTLEGYKFDPNKAKALLDEAGYKDVTGDGLREDPKGKPFVINFASMSGSEIAEPLAKYYIQCWRDVGLDVRLVNGRLIEFNSFYDMIQKDDSKVDMFQAAWRIGSDPDPSGIWHSDQAFNYPRWVNAGSDQLLKDGISPKAFDDAYRVDVYKKWQRLVFEEAPLIPTLFRYGLTSVNTRVQYWDLTPGKLRLNEVAITSDKAVQNVK